MREIKKLLPPKFKVQIIEKEPPLFVAEDNQYIKKLQEITAQTLKKRAILYGAQGSSDARHFTQVSCDGIEFGPIGKGIGSDNEWVDIPSLKTYTNVLIKYLLSL